MRQSPLKLLLSSQMIGVRPATVSRNAAKAGGGSPDPLIRTFAISAALADGKGTGCVSQAIERFIMENNRFAVDAQLDVAFDGEAAGDGRLGRAQRVFDSTLRAVMQAAVGDRPLDEPGRGVDRRQPSISKTASTSASASSGRCDTPTVVRACRPFSPNSSAMKLEAPFIAWGRASKLDSTLKNPPSRTTCFTLSRSPSAACAWAAKLMAQSSGRLARGVNLGIGRELALVALGELPIFPERQLAGDEQQRSGAHERDVIRDRRRRFGQNDAHLFQAFGDSAHGGANSSACLPVAREAKPPASDPRLCRLSGEGKLVFGFPRA